MIQPITLNVPSKIEFGAGKIEALETHLQECGRVFFLIDPPVLPHIDPIIETLKAAGKAVLVSTEVVPEPPIRSLLGIWCCVK